jgi:allophanate hydrolase
MDMAAVAVPGGLREDGKPNGVSLIGPAFSEEGLLRVADRLHRELQNEMGATGQKLKEAETIDPKGRLRGVMEMAVVGAHLNGQPLNGQLTERRARLVRTTRTAASYRLFALKGTVPAKPGLVFDPGFTGPGIEVEVWAMPEDTVGSFLAGIPAPLGLGTLVLEDGSTVKGFLCEPVGIADAEEITHLGGWRAYRAQAT